MKNIIRHTLLSLAGVLLVSSQAFAAGTASQNLAVSATVENNCLISTSALAFGPYDYIVTHKVNPLDGTGTVHVTCTSGASVTISLDQGLNTDRRMINGAVLLNYELYTASDYLTIWDDGLNKVPHTGTGASVAIPVYGRIAGNQNVLVGSYVDTIVATVNF